jgi:uncharacterized RDD family membrane protein YckC
LFNGDEPGNHEIHSNYYEVRRRRMLAFIVDYIIIAILCIPAAALIGFAGILTFGLGWILYAAMVPLVVFAYLGFTMGGKNQATIGMAMFSIHIRRLDGRLVDAPLAILHGILFWFIHSALSPLMLLASLFSSRKRLLQDWLLGTEVVYRDVG